MNQTETSYRVQKVEHEFTEFVDSWMDDLTYVEMLQLSTIIQDRLEEAVKESQKAS